MDDRRPPERRAWYRALLDTTPCTAEYSEMSSMLIQLSCTAEASRSSDVDV